MMKTISEIRRNNLLLAISIAGGATALSKLSSVSAAYISQVKNKQPESTTGKPKGMGDSVARKIEKAINKPCGWMDQDHDQEKSSNERDQQPSDERKIKLHPTTQRLYEVVKHVSDISTQSELAAAMGVSPQVIGNWEARGMSFEGMILAEEYFGCSPAWLKTGTGDGKSLLKSGRESYQTDVDRIAFHLRCLSPERLQALSVLLGIQL